MRRRRWAVAMVGLALWAGGPGSVWAQPPAGFYDQVNDANPASLRADLHELIDDHQRFQYTSSTETDTWDILEEADEDPADPGRIVDVYRNASYPKAGGGNSLYNREHSWPKSHGFPDDGRDNSAYTDCHHLFLSDSSYNSSRGNKPYGGCDGTCREKPTGDAAPAGVHPGTSNWSSSEGWEVWSGRRGDVARALFYMDVRYDGGFHGRTGHPEPDLVLTDDASLIDSAGDNRDVAHMGLLSVLLAWHREDPVDERERHHHEAVARSQGNRNPFVDHPEWVACVFEQKCAAEPEGPDGEELRARIEELVERIEALEAELGAIKGELEELGGEEPE